MEVFECLPLAAHVNGMYLCVHGGISDKLQNLSDINLIDRIKEPEDDTLLADLLWADPMD
jgi:serine/threonine-protein phosphatase 2B catalytic subunit